MSRSNDGIGSNFGPLGDDPISLIEEYAIDQDWNAERTHDHELWAELPGYWGSYRLWVAYYEDTGYLQFNCYLNMKIPDRMVGTVAHVITLMNERIWLGHFEIWSEEKVPVFQVVIPLREATLTRTQVEDVMTATFNEIERFFPTFQWVIWGGKTPEEAVAATIVDTEGEA